MSVRSAGIEVRAATDDDLPAVLGLLQASLGWVPDDDHARFFAWKHHRSPFGRSPAWVAVDPAEGGRVVGFRTFARWEFERDGQVVRAVRAVDTATHPDYQGRGLFTLLTRQALDELRDEGVSFVFNTPNDRSRPGYLKMGWQPVRRLPVAARPRSPLSLVRLSRSRTAADKWSADTAAGQPAAEALADREAVAGLLAGTEARPGVLRTRRSPEYLAWRYGFAPLRYRVLGAGGPGHGGEAGLVIFRLRRRGRALEAAVCEELLPPGGGEELRRGLHRDLLRTTGADHAVVIGAPRPARGLLPVPGQGPTLVWRGVADETMPAPDCWDVSLGDIELF